MATCDRWGDVTVLRKVARAEAPHWYCARVRRRALRDRFPPLPVGHAVSSPHATTTPAPPSLRLASPGSSPTVVARSPSAASSPVRVVRGAPVPCAPRGLVGALSVCPSLIARAESRGAPVLFNDMCDGGAISAVQAISRHDWASPSIERHAAVLARALDLLPRARCPRAWSVLVCNLAACFLEDIHPPFHDVRLRAAAGDKPFSLVPIRGRYGWRKRARWAGLVDDAGVFHR